LQAQVSAGAARRLAPQAPAGRASNLAEGRAELFELLAIHPETAE